MHSACLHCCSQFNIASHMFCIFFGVMDYSTDKRFLTQVVVWISRVASMRKLRFWLHLALLQGRASEQDPCSEIHYNLHICFAFCSTCFPTPFFAKLQRQRDSYREVKVASCYFFYWCFFMSRVWWFVVQIVDW